MSVKLLFSWLCWPPSVSLLREQEHAPMIPAPHVAWGGGEGEFSSCSYFSHHSNFSHWIFPVKFYFSRQRHTASLGQSREHSLPPPSLLVFLLFIFFPRSSIFFSQPLFPVKLLFSGGRFLLFFPFIPPSSSQCMMLHVPIKIYLPKLTFSF